MATPRPPKKPTRRMARLWAMAEPIIEDIIDGRAHNDSFAYFDVEDIAQEIRTWCFEVLDRYDESRGPLDRFLRSHVHNRVCNLRRNRLVRPRPDRQMTDQMRRRIHVLFPCSIEPRKIVEATRPDGTSLISMPNDDSVDWADFKARMAVALPSGLVLMASGYLRGHDIGPSGIHLLEQVTRIFMGEY